MTDVPYRMAEPIDWQHVAVMVYRADGHCNLLTTPERDALLAADREEPPADPSMPARDATALLRERFQ